MSKKRQRSHKSATPTDNRKPLIDLSKIEKMPTSFQEVEKFFNEYKVDNPYLLRVEAIKRIEKETETPLICYVSQTDLLPPQAPPELYSIVHGDLEGFDNLVDGIKINNNSNNIDIFLVSNGGVPEATERIVRLLRNNFERVRLIIPNNAYSAATLIGFACDTLLMTDIATLGPIDPQINGTPARAILRGFERLEERLKEEGPEALTAYIHLLNTYKLADLEACRTAEELSRELATTWLSNYMLKHKNDDNKITEIVHYFTNYDDRKSHARSIGYYEAEQLGLEVELLKRGENLTNLVKSLYAQQLFFFRKTPFVKLFESGYGTSFGNQLIIQPASSDT